MLWHIVDVCSDHIGTSIKNLEAGTSPNEKNLLKQSLHQMQEKFHFQAHSIQERLRVLHKDAYGNHYNTDLPKYLNINR